jgi:two-component system, OmpR family, sensor histidine kinase SenX3
VREIRRSEQHDSFINAVTHELKTPVASIRLHLETLQRRDLPEAQKQEFYRLMLSDTDRLDRDGGAGAARRPRRATRRRDGKSGSISVNWFATAWRLRGRGIIWSRRLCGYEGASSNGERAAGAGQRGGLAYRGFNVLDNAIKYSGDSVDVRVRLDTPDEKRIVLRVQDQGVGIPPTI